MEKNISEPSWNKIKEWIQAERCEALELFRHHPMPAKPKQKVCREKDKEKKTAIRRPLAWQIILTAWLIVGVFLGIYLTTKKELIKEKNVGVVAFFQQSEKLLDLYNRRSVWTENTSTINKKYFRTGQRQDSRFSYLEQTIDRFFSINFKRFLEVKNG